MRWPDHDWSRRRVLAWAVLALLGGGGVACRDAGADAPPTPMMGGLKVDFIPQVRDISSLARLPDTHLIVIGTVTATLGTLAGTGRGGDPVLFTDWAVRVDQPVRAAAASHIIIVRGLGGAGPMGTYRVDAQVQLTPGDQVLLFLTEGHPLLQPTSDNVYSAVGEGYGIYRVEGDQVRSSLDPSIRLSLDQVVQDIRRASR